MNNDETPTLTFDGIVVGAVYADRTFEVSLKAAVAYLAAVSDEGVPAAPVEEVPIMMPASWTVPRVSFEGCRIPSGGIHARQVWHSFHPIASGESVRVVTKAREKYHYRNRPYVVFESTIANAEGTIVARGEMTIVWPL